MTTTQDFIVVLVCVRVYTHHFYPLFEMRLQIPHGNKTGKLSICMHAQILIRMNKIVI